MAKERPLKRAKVGLEVEMFILDNEGYISSDVDKLIRKCNSKNPKYMFKRESSKSILEMNPFPNVKVENAAKSFLDSLELVIECANELDLKIYPHGTYPGKFVPKPGKGEWFELSDEVFGARKYRNAAGKVAGFHFHYCLPRGVYNKDTGTLKKLVKSKTKKALLSEYNMLIACDPVLTTLLQSSPFSSGRYIAKDSRLFLYRDMKYRERGLKIDGLYREHSLFGELPRYQRTIEDLNYLIQKRYDRWVKLVKGKSSRFNSLLNNMKPTNFAWNPLRVNSLGTLEQRGMDMNYPKYLFGVTLLLKYVLKQLDRNYLRVKPSDIGIKEPFKVEGDVIYVPPHSVVKHTLQYASAIEGLANEQVLDYCKRFMKFALSYVKEKYDPTVCALKSLLEREKTVSDIIIKMVRKKGYGLDEKIPNDVFAEIALRRASKMLREIEETKNSILVLEEQNGNI